VGIGSGDGGEERWGMEGAGVEEVGGFCGVRNVSNCRYVIDARTGVKIETGGTRVRTSAGFECVGTEGKDVGGEAGFEERSFVGRYGRLG
jgi:hypothetical protein